MISNRKTSRAKGELRESRVGGLAPQQLAEIDRRSVTAVREWGFAIQESELAPPRTGTFDGTRIVIDPRSSLECRCFILLHLFGHSVQWVAPSLADRVAALLDSQGKPWFLETLREYEYEAARFGLRLLHDAGVRDVDGWFSDYVESDWRYVETFYREGRFAQWSECVACSERIVTPLEIPELELRQVEVRYAF